MLILCPACASVYDIDERKLGPAGRNVRCKRCAHTWFERPEAADEPVALLRGTLAPDETAMPTVASPIGRDALPGTGLATAADPRSQASAPEREGLQRMPGLQDEAADGGGSGVFDAPSLDHEQSLDHDEAERASETADARATDRRPGGKRPKAGRDTAGAGRGRGIASRALAAASLVAACLLLGAVAWRDDLVRQWPGVAKAYASLGLRAEVGSLRVARVTSALGQGDGAELLVVEGDVVNGGLASVDAPSVRIAVRDGAGMELYTWTAQGPGRRLEPGERSPFRARLASPPPSGASVGVSLAGPDAPAQGASR